MKKFFFLLGIATLATAGFIMFKILTVDNGKENTKDDSSPAGIPAEETSQEAGQEAREGIHP